MSRRSKLSTVPAKSITQDKYTVLVVRIAQIVPIGILFWASARSPDLFDPAIIPLRLIFLPKVPTSNTNKYEPVTDGKKIPINKVNEVVISARISLYATSPGVPRSRWLSP